MLVDHNTCSHEHSLFYDCIDGHAIVRCIACEYEWDCDEPTYDEEAMLRVEDIR